VDPTGSQSAIPVPSGNLLLLRDRIVILSVLGIVTLLSWVYLVDMAQGMDGMMGAQHCAGMMEESWTAGYFTAMLVMWIIMMVGMMVPSAIPMVLIYASVARKAARQGSPLAPTGIFVTGYVVIWSLSTPLNGPRTWVAFVIKVFLKTSSLFSTLVLRTN
jgi:predicted metal-binding membrane protein